MSIDQTPVGEGVGALLCAIRSSETYQRFEAVKAQMAGHPGEREAVDAFRKDAFLLTNSTEPLDMLEEMNRLEQRARELRRNPLIAEYLSAENELCRMLQEICEQVIGITDLQIDGFMDAIPL